MSIREKLLNKPKKPLHKVEIGGETYFLRHPTIGIHDRARRAATIAVSADGTVDTSKMSNGRFGAALLIDMVVDEGNNLQFTAADMDVLAEAEIGSDLEQLMTEAGRLVKKAADTGKNSTPPTEPA